VCEELGSCSVSGISAVGITDWGDGIWMNEEQVGGGTSLGRSVRLGMMLSRESST